ncbi:MAG: hypothetical protein PHZ09_02635 [Eubacteriales bacterium]|nr:hypothetical protein [Eubacteriales bacterium]
MYKRSFLLTLTLIFVLTVFLTACQKESDLESADTTAGENAETTVAPAEETEEPEPETEAPPRDKYKYIDFYEDDGGGHNPYSLMAEGSSIGVHFKVEEGFLEDFSINCPSWSNDIGSLTMRVYKWDTDYASTVAASPVAEETFVDYVDNDWLIMYFDDDGAKGLEAGEYLVTLGDGVDESGSGVGLWTYGPIDDPAIVNYYANGEITEDYGWEAAATIIIPAS